MSKFWEGFQKEADAKVLNFERTPVKQNHSPETKRMFADASQQIDEAFSRLRDRKPISHEINEYMAKSSPAATASHVPHAPHGARGGVSGKVLGAGALALGAVGGLHLYANHKGKKLRAEARKARR